MDPVRELPYWPAAKALHIEAEQMAASDYVPTYPHLLLASEGASTDAVCSSGFHGIAIDHYWDKSVIAVRPSSDGFATKTCRSLLTGTAGGEVQCCFRAFRLHCLKESTLPKRLVIFIAPALLSFRPTGILLQCQHE